MAKRLIHYDKDGVTSWISDAASGLKGDGFQRNYSPQQRTIPWFNINTSLH
jgi:hypothetical protein